MGIQFTGLASGLDTQSIIADLMKVERMRVEEKEKEKTMAEWKKDAWSDMNTKLYSFYKEDLFEFKSAGTYSQKLLTSSNESLVKVNDSPGAIKGSHSIEVTQMAKGSFLTGKAITDSSGGEVTSTTKVSDLTGATVPGSISMSLNGTDTVSVNIDSDDTIADVVSKMKDTGLDINANFDSNHGRFFLSSKESGEGIQLALSGDDALLNALGFEGPDTSLPIEEQVDYRTGTVAQDAKFKYNGTELTSSTNEVSVNGISMTIQADTGTTTLNVTQDIDAIYDSVKSFITKYNELMTDIQEKIGADSARDYDPLTDDEKNAMTDDEVELWEDKIKDSLFRRDDTLTSIASTMRGMLGSAAGVDTSGFTYNSLADLGIVTGSYTEKGLLHIEGDEDEPLLNVKTNKLREAIENDPDAVMEIMTGIGQTLYDDMADKMKATTLSSALTFYNNKYLDDQIGDIEDDIYDLEDKLVTIESRYYKQFSAMEQAIQQSNSTGEWLASQLGGM